MRVYVIQDYDAVVYAGTSLKQAKKHVKGGRGIDIWQDGKIIGIVRYHSWMEEWYDAAWDD